MVIKPSGGKSTAPRPAVGRGLPALPWCPLNPSGVFQLWSFQRAGSARAPLCGHAPVCSASVSKREQEEKENKHQCNTDMPALCHKQKEDFKREMPVSKKALMVSSITSVGCEQRQRLLFAHSALSNIMNQ